MESISDGLDGARHSSWVQYINKTTRYSKEKKGVGKFGGAKIILMVGH